MEKARIDLITGFLGAGKTTFIRNYADSLRAADISFAIIENEFGAAGVDAALLGENGARVYEISGGCVCCTQKVNFHDAIKRFAGEVERVIIEPSGIFRADDYLNMLKSPSLSAIALPGMLACVISPELPLPGSADEGVLRDELAHARAAIISRTDVAPAEDIRRVREWLMDAGVEPSRIFAKPFSRYSAADYDALADLPDAPCRFAPSTVAHQTAFQSTTLYPARTFTREQARACLESLKSQECGRVLRAKGRLPGEGETLFVNMTPDGFTVESLPPCQGAYVNVIGQRLRRKEINAIFE